MASAWLDCPNMILNQVAHFSGSPNSPVVAPEECIKQCFMALLVVLMLWHLNWEFNLVI